MIMRKSTKSRSNHQFTPHSHYRRRSKLFAVIILVLDITVVAFVVALLYVCVDFNPELKAAKSWFSYAHYLPKNIQKMVPGIQKAESVFAILAQKVCNRKGFWASVVWIMLSYLTCILGFFGMAVQKRFWVGCSLFGY
eukprot:145785_1